ncbi:MAG: hypothetical protein KC422_20005 [Trueperaceae bacterium]|nr:hypothetical protein [Trueperaceae bacterium]
MTGKYNVKGTGWVGRLRFCSKTFLLALLVLLATFIAQVKAQDLLDLFEVGCTELGFLEGYEWICKAGDLAHTVNDLLQSFHEDFVGFGQELFDDWMQDALASIAEQANLADLTALFDDLDTALTEGPIAFREAIRNAVAGLRLSNYANREDAADLINQLEAGDVRDYRVLYDIAAQLNPTIVAAEGMMNARQDQLLESRAEAAAVHDLNTQLAEEVATSTRMQDAVAQVLEPSFGGLGGGDAAQLDDAARTAVSSRAAIQVMTEGLADLMRQQATFSGYISDNLRVLTQQQVMTTWELQLAINALTEQMNKAISEEKAAIEAQLARDYDAGVELAESLSNVAQETATSLSPEFEELEFESLGW